MDEQASLTTAEAKFREAVQREQSKLMAAGAGLAEAMEVLLSRVRGTGVPSFTGADVACLMQGYGYTREDAARALTIREEIRNLRNMGASAAEAAEELTRRLAGGWVGLSSSTGGSGARTWAGASLGVRVGAGVQEGLGPGGCVGHPLGSPPMGQQQQQQQQQEQLLQQQVPQTSPGAESCNRSSAAISTPTPSSCSSSPPAPNVPIAPDAPASKAPLSAPNGTSTTAGTWGMAPRGGEPKAAGADVHCVGQAQAQEVCASGDSRCGSGLGFCEGVCSSGPGAGEGQGVGSDSSTRAQAQLTGSGAGAGAGAGGEMHLGSGGRKRPFWQASQGHSNMLHGSGAEEGHLGTGSGSGTAVTCSMGAGG
ncbi:unnamed protein product, partial [Discosporangium mesarthrocarpum]